ncbi:MAG: hypothetical protein K8S97_13160 [Anaerolineae bacterium]|nr:hypothetical protein [Anaerolineae bacterium]
MSASLARRNAIVLMVFFTLLLFGLELVAVLQINEGHLMYSLDDPYIHLAVAEEITQGGYGINSTAYSSPSSSVVWPLLLTPFVWLGLDLIAPLLLTALAACLTVWLYVDLFFTALDQKPSFYQRRFALLLAILIGLLLFTNVVGLAFTGMEHSAHLLLAVAVLWGLVRERDSGQIVPGLAVALVLGPLIRYEQLALTIPALALLFLRGHRRPALILGVLTILPLLAFSGFLVALDLSPMPSSVMVKSASVAGHSSLDALLHQFRQNLTEDEGQSLLALITLLLAYVLAVPRTRRDWPLALWAAAAGFLHLVFGRNGWFARYEIYIWTTLVFSVLIVARPLWNRALARYNAAALLLALSPAMLLFSHAFDYPLALGMTHYATNNVYQQQYQMHRFATEFYQGPVAVNDLGWVAYRNDHYVLDLWGLGLHEAYEHRQRDDNPRWMDELAAEHDVQLAMIYMDWFDAIPDHWIPLAELRLGRIQVTAAGKVIVFYALDPAAVPRIQTALDAFAADLPATAELIRLSGPQE